MVKAAGILLLDKDGLALFTQRAPGQDHAGFWCIPGGKIEEGETALQAACRETLEEVGYNCRETDCTELTRRVKDGVDFTTFLCRTKEPFPVKTGQEVMAFAWGPPSQPPQPLHPGCHVTLARLDMNELGVAEAMVAGELASPQRYENFTLFDLRVTGTGMAFRNKWQEFVWRDAELYLNEEFLRRCNGLPVILEHPKKNVLDSAEYKGRNIGSLFLPYVKGTEVWAIAKIWDEDAAKLMATDQLSTSPAVVWRDPSANVQTELEDGNKFLIEGKPSLLDHLAICEQGVWDKGGGPSGVNIGEVAMADEARKDEKAAADSATANQDKENTRLEKLLGVVVEKFDGFLTRIDAIEQKVFARKDEDKEEEKADAAAKAKADAKKKADEEEDEKADSKKKADGEKEEEKSDAEVKNKVIVDAKAKKADNEDEDEKADAAKKAKADAAKKKGDNDEPEALAADSSKIVVDKTWLDKVMGRLDKVETVMPKPLTDADHDAFANIQHRADQVYGLFGKRAPQPMNGETPLAYRWRLLRDFREHAPTYKDTDFRALAVADENTFGVVESHIYKAAADAARNPSSVPMGTLREVTENRGGHTYTRFYGRPASWMAGFAPVGRRVKRVNQPGRGPAVQE